MAQYLQNWQDRSECQAVPQMSKHVHYRQQCVMSWPNHTGQMHQARRCTEPCTQHCLWITEKCVRTVCLNLTEYHKATVDVHGSVHRNINLIESTNKMQPCSRIYYSNVS